MAMLSPSVLNADFLNLKNDLVKLEQIKIDMLHMDVMDGNFVPNISFGTPVIESIKKHTSLPIDVHLMIERPHRYIEQFACVADYLGFHYEAGSPVKETLLRIKELGCKPYLTVKPNTPIDSIAEFLPFCSMVLVMSVEPGFGGQVFMQSALSKISRLKELRLENHLDFFIEVDGGINAETAKQSIEAGADVLVVGSFLFGSNDIEKTANILKSY